MMNSQGEWGRYGLIRRVIFQQYFKFDGRASRTEYWWFLIAYIGMALTMGVVVGLVESGVSVSRGAELHWFCLVLWH